MKGKEEEKIEREEEEEMLRSIEKAREGASEGTSEAKEGTGRKMYVIVRGQLIYDMFPYVTGMYPFAIDRVGKAVEELRRGALTSEAQFMHIMCMEEEVKYELIPIIQNGEKYTMPKGAIEVKHGHVAYRDKTTGVIETERLPVWTEEWLYGAMNRVDMMEVEGLK